MKRQNLRSLTLRVLQIPYSFWVFIGFFITYLYFFIQPIFLREHVMQFFTYLPAIDPIGEDLRQILHFTRPTLVKICTHPLPVYYLVHCYYSIFLLLTG